MRVHKLIKLRYKVGNANSNSNRDGDDDGDVELRAASAARICRIITGRELCDSFATSPESSRIESNRIESLLELEASQRCLAAKLLL